MSLTPDWLRALTGRRLRLKGHFADPVVIESAEDFGEVVQLAVRTLRGEPKDAIVGVNELIAAVEAAEKSGPEDVVNAFSQFLYMESARIRLAYAWDPYFAVSLCGIEPLPHQLEAVYEKMLPQPRLRFLLADDPGAGKTIMGGLLLKELKLRGAVERVLILAPAPLTLQWQDELRSKFDEVFERVDSHLARDQLGGSPWSRFPQCVASMDFAKQERIAPLLLRERWDLVIVDEAHKVSMPDLDSPTMRFKLVRALADRADRLLLLTATPHQGNPAQFRNLLSLLDEHAFRDDGAVHRLLKQENNPWLLRRMKEDLYDFRGRKLFVERHTYSEEFSLNADEWELYQDVTAYINKYLPKQVGRRKQSAALARTVLQRRLASSLRAIRMSLEGRHGRIQTLVEELEGLPDDKRVKRLRELVNLPVDAEMDEDDETEETLDEAAKDAIAVERFDQLLAELEALGPLVEQALRVEAKGDESKLNRLMTCLQGSDFTELKDAGGKLLIFTEHRATLELLRETMEKRGYSCCVIHGGMDAVARKEAQRQFQKEKQVCIGTDAAGEGINLQFCHLMVNYDMPWNPNRLEQRMGRIHRFGQEREVHVFNFMAVCGPLGEEIQPVVEGRVLQVLLKKLVEIRKGIGDRVYDVIGLLLRTNGLNLEEVLREATYHPKLLSDYLEQVQAVSADRLVDYEKATGVALARKVVDLRVVQGRDFESEERRLMPEFVEDFFQKASDVTGLRLARRANPALLRIEHVPQRFRARSLVSVRTRGEPETAYPKATFRKAELKKNENLDGELLSPGHPLYAAVDEVLNLSLTQVAGGAGRWLDAYGTRPYRLHFFEVECEGESLGDPGQPARAVPIHSTLVVVQEQEDGTLDLAQPDILHDLKDWTSGTSFPAIGNLGVPPDPAVRKRIEGWVRARVQHPRVESLRADRAREVGIRRDFLLKAFDVTVKDTQKRQMLLHARVMAGEKEAALARDEAGRRIEELDATREHRLRVLDHLEIVRSGRLAYLGSALVAPQESGSGSAMHNDPEVEQAAYRVAIAHEQARGWTVDEVWKRKDGSGFDLRSVSPPAEGGLRLVRRIEVKGRAGDDGEVHLSPNEWRKAEHLRDTYWLYVVWGAKGPSPHLKAIQDPWATLRQSAVEVVQVKGWRIPADALAEAAGEEWNA